MDIYIIEITKDLLKQKKNEPREPDIINRTKIGKLKYRGHIMSNPS